MIKEFKEFINKGNVMDMAVGVIIGAAFGAIVTSLVNDIIMPLVGFITGGVDVSGLSVKVGDAVLTYGNFIQAIINFLIIALAIFFMVKGVNKLTRKKKEEEKPAKPDDVKLLEEIRDLLKKQK
jgi:large conductance mechanosensitive channel